MSVVKVDRPCGWTLSGTPTVSATHERATTGDQSQPRMQASYPTTSMLRFHEASPDRSLCRVVVPELRVK